MNWQTAATLLASLLAVVGTVASALLVRRQARAEKVETAREQATAAEATGRHAVATEEVRMVPRLLERIEALEDDRDECREENAQLKATVADLRDEVAELKAARANDARLMQELRQDIAELRRQTLG
jgi:predicted RNase H-like nuclease (RuvC/YqgF family)